MSKMSQLHAELSEQAYELGFKSIEEAEANGYVIDYEKQKLVQPNELQEKNLVEAIDGLDKLQKELEKAHEEWLKERDHIIEALKNMYDNYIEGDYKTNSEKETLMATIEFIEKGEM